jgi:hypothetical protein
MIFSTELIETLDWTDALHKCAEFGNQFVDDQACYENSIKIKDTHTIIKRLAGSEIPTWIRNCFNVEIQVLQIFAINPRSVGLIHKDGVNRCCALNIPIKNCDQGYMQWFEPSAFTEFFIGNDYTTIRITNEEIDKGEKIDIPPLHSTQLTKPSIVNTDVWHRVDNRDSDNYRWMLSLRFKNNPSFESLSNELILK